MISVFSDTALGLLGIKMSLLRRNWLLLIEENAADNTDCNDSE